MRGTKNCQRSYSKELWMVVVAGEDLVNHGRTTSSNEQASWCHPCCASQMTELDRHSFQHMHLSEYPNDARASRVLVITLMSLSPRSLAVVVEAWKKLQNIRWRRHLHKSEKSETKYIKKVFTTMVTRALDDHKYYARSAFNHLGERCTIVRCITSQPIYILKCALLTFSSTSSRLAEIWRADF